LADGVDTFLDFAHKKERIEFEKDFHIEAGTGAACTDFVEALVVIESEDELTQNSKLGGLFDRSIEKIVYGGGGHGPGGVKHKKDPDERGEGI